MRTSIRKYFINISQHSVNHIFGIDIRILRVQLRLCTNYLSLNFIRLWQTGCRLHTAEAWVSSQLISRVIRDGCSDAGESSVLQLSPLSFHLAPHPPIAAPWDVVQCELGSTMTHLFFQYRLRAFERHSPGYSAQKMLHLHSWEPLLADWTSLRKGRRISSLGAFFDEKRER
jgi:hypothetical protein